MKLSDYAKKVGVSYKTAWRWFKDGKLDAYQMDTGTIIVNETSNNLSKLSTASSVGSNACGDGKVHSFGKVAV